MAAEIYSQVTLIIEQFESLEDPPDPPLQITGSTVFQWSVEMAPWIRDIEAVVDAAHGMAKARERKGFPSVELAQKTADARAGLQKLRKLISKNSELTDWKLDPTIPQTIREDVAAVVALAVNS